MFVIKTEISYDAEDTGKLLIGLAEALPQLTDAILNIAIQIKTFAGAVAAEGKVAEDATAADEDVGVASWDSID